MLGLGLVVLLIALLFLVTITIGLLISASYWIWNLLNNETFAEYFYHNNGQITVEEHITQYLQHGSGADVEDERLLYLSKLKEEYERIKKVSKELILYWWADALVAIFVSVSDKCSSGIKNYLNNKMAKLVLKIHGDKWTEERLKGINKRDTK